MRVGGVVAEQFVVLPGQVQQVVAALGLVQGGGQLQGQRRRCVFVQLAIDQHQMPAQVAGQRCVVEPGKGRRHAIGHGRGWQHATEQPVHAVQGAAVHALEIVTAGRGHAHLVERRVAQQCPRRAVTAERMPVDADPLQVDARVAFAQLAQRGHMVIQLHIGAVQEAAVMEGLVAAAGAARIDADHHEAKLGQAGA